MFWTLYRVQWNFSEIELHYVGYSIDTEDEGDCVCPFFDVRVSDRTQD